MTLFERYLNGEHEAVYDELYTLREEVLSPGNFLQADMILTETFKRAWFNLNEIHKELRAINYQFIANPEFDWQRPLTPPAYNAKKSVAELQEKVSHMGHIPLSLQYFYRQIGSCNFCWDWETVPDILWEGSDPIDIPPVKELIDLIDEEFEEEEIFICGDVLHKDNISGTSYTLELTERPAVDSLFHGHNIPFVAYLRRTFYNCGFTLADECDYHGLNTFCERVRPRLLPI